MYTFSSGVNAIQEWYKLHYMNIMAQIDAEEKERMSYSAEELMLSCLFDGDSCDARSALGKGKARAGTWAAPGSPRRGVGRACWSLASSEGRANSHEGYIGTASLACRLNSVSGSALSRHQIHSTNQVAEKLRPDLARVCN